MMMLSMCVMQYGHFSRRERHEQEKLIFCNIDGFILGILLCPVQDVYNQRGFSIRCRSFVAIHDILFFEPILGYNKEKQ
jgi:hypothetical protein